ncbi:unnamed protein product [Blepharisma stoltei]|uniref:Uncharacterized protein n=1 Tax=Blepharisma stoltei TaxID=1481888 RepID=A0AAU9IGK6_9CILI|nr:unnamed protein product [Blepharisma stoltei]
MDSQFPILKVFCKVLLIGKSGVGKTSILLQSTENFFPSEHKPTIAVDCRIRNSMHDSRVVRLMIFDPPGKESLATLTPAYWYSVDAIIFVVDDRVQSLRYVKDKVNAIFGSKDEELLKKVLKIILVNKKDLITGEEGKNYKNEIKNYANEYDMKYYKCSASDPAALNEIFKYIIDTLFSNPSKEKAKQAKEKLKTQKRKNICSRCSLF